ncbi:chloramphenicol 3-O phosphotransferase [Streptomyces sp. WMMB 714]|nr:chloramphenicol 3-O phosphotransferase [Streptomyces sp. WMMB 714]
MVEFRFNVWVRAADGPKGPPGRGRVPRPVPGGPRHHPGSEISDVNTQVIVLNGGSSSGKTGISRCLQAILPTPWITLGVDDLVARLPPSLTASGSGIAIGERGEVEVGAEFRRIESAWTAGIAAMARAGARVIIDDVFLGGGASQERTRGRLAGLEVLWAGVRCEAETAAARELARGDRVVGMAAAQADSVHEGVVYDVEVDSAKSEALDCARAIAALVN